MSKDNNNFFKVKNEWSLIKDKLLEILKSNKGIVIGGLVGLLIFIFGLEAFAQSVVDYVNPFIGTTNFGTCNPGAVCPNGMMSVVPFNVMGSDMNVYDKDARWFSTPYEYKNSFFNRSR